MFNRKENLLDYEENNSSQLQHNLRFCISSFYTCLRYFNHLLHKHHDLLSGAMIFQNSSDGMLITDTNHKIISINRSFSTITGYSDKEVLGKNPRFLQSGRHDKLFYQDLWSSVKKLGHWQGEVWNKRKNGEIYPELLTINTIKNKSGDITHHMGVFSDISAVEARDEGLQHLAFHDPLTGLPNRLKLQERLKQEVICANHSQLSMALLFIDFDGFKAVNDQYGHNFGDTILTMAANRLNNAKRNTDFLARVGGDEFVLIINSLSDEKIISNIATKIIESMKAPFHIDEHNVVIGASIGISIYPQFTTDINGLLEQADKAMYQAKKSGRNHYTFFQ